MALRDSLRHFGLSAVAALNRPDGVPLRDIRTFLLLQHASALGTVIHATPLIPALRAAVPGAHITAAASGFGLEILSRNPGVDELVAMPNPVQEPVAAVRALRGLKLCEPFATLTPVGNERTAIAVAAAFGGGRNLVGHTHTQEVYRAPLSFDFAESQIRNNLRVVEAHGHGAAEHYEPQVFFSEEDLSYARALAGGAGRLAVFVTQTSPTQRKSWRPERFVAAAQFLLDECAMERILFVGSKSERPAIDAMLPRIRGDVKNVAGETSLGQLAALLSLAEVGLTLDTGTMHVGRAVGLPMVIIAPAWSPPLEWLPVGDDRFRILKNAEMDAAPADYVIDEVSVEEVQAALADLLRHRKETENATSQQVQR